MNIKTSAEQNGEGGSFYAAVCQFEPAFLEKGKNLKKIGELAEKAKLAGADLVIFPECCLTGYGLGEVSRNMADLAEMVEGKDKGPSIKALEKLADELNVYLVVGLPELYGESVVFNSAVHIAPKNGVIKSYRKVHMWESENQVFTEGSGYFVLPAPVGHFGSLICYDLEFPEASRSLALLGADLIAVSTANMKPWQEFQTVYARSRAMENSVYIAVANCVGSISGTEFFGGSLIVDPCGRVIAAASDSEAVLVSKVELSNIRDIENKTNYLRRRRAETYKIIADTELKTF